MKQGNLFDEEYEATLQPVDNYNSDQPTHTSCNSLYDKPVEGLIKQRLVTYFTTREGQVKRVEKIRSFVSGDVADTVISEVLK
tara:strand:+ start:467 stop:715 length:249 start_codon:yes stop_codon:yes gene_type:complete